MPVAKVLRESLGERRVEGEARKELRTREEGVEPLARRRTAAVETGPYPASVGRARPVARPLGRAQRMRPSHVELKAVGEERERVAGRAAGSDLRDVPGRVAVCEQVEVEVLPERLPAEHRQLGEIIEGANVLGRQTRGPEELAIVADVLLGVPQESLEPPELDLLQLVGRQPLGS